MVSSQKCMKKSALFRLLSYVNCDNCSDDNGDDSGNYEGIILMSIIKRHN